MDRAVGYYRVSTRQQQRSGLGIEAQRAAVERFAEAENLTIIAEFVEAETARAPMRSTGAQLAAALAQARQTKCCVLVSKLDRLSRDVPGAFDDVDGQLPPTRGVLVSRKRSLMKVASTHQGTDLSIRDIALEHPEATVRMDISDPFGTKHLLGPFDCARDLIRRLDFR